MSPSPSPPTARSASTLPPEPVASVAGIPHSVVRQVNHLIEFGPYTVEVDATDGGRIVRFALEGRSIVATRSESPEAYGSSIWPSPQSDWEWPPPPAFNTLAWQTRGEGSALVLESGTDDKLQLAGVQRLTADLERGQLCIDVTFVNRGNEPRSVAPWQNTRVRPRGLTFYPSSRPAYDWSSLRLAPQDGVVWFQHDPEKLRESAKLYADGEEGWVAHVDGDLILVKVFPNVPPEQQAPREGEIIIYVHESGRFVEVEQQGAYATLLPGEAFTWPVRWILRRLPPDVVARPGNPRLVQFVRSVVAASRP